MKPILASSCSTAGSFTFDEQPISDYEVVQLIAESNNPVFLARSKTTEDSFAIKLFHFKKDNMSLSYMNEQRFSVLSHPNIIRTICTYDKVSLQKNYIKSHASAKIMELAFSENFKSLLLKTNFSQDEKLVRTYFHQLIEGIDYLHSQKMAHVDLKLSNLLLGSDYNLKITDFDNSYVSGDIMIISRGTKFYRAPEIYKNECEDPMAADIYSAGIILFVMMTGHFPHAKDEADLAKLLHGENQRGFWNRQVVLDENKKQRDFSQEFKDLFWSMTRINPSNRASIQSIKQNAWYQGPIYCAQELRVRMREKLFKISLNHQANSL